MTTLVKMYDVDNNIEILHRAVACKVIKRNEHGSPSVLKIMPEVCHKDEIQPGDCFILAYIDESEFKEM